MSGPLSPLSPRPEIIVDQDGFRLTDPDGASIGMPGPFPKRRLVWALPTNFPGGGPSQRYAPPFPQGDSAPIGLDLSLTIPLGLGISTASLSIFTNAATPTASTDFVIGAVTIEGRSVYANISGGVGGRDYQMRWTVTDTLGDTVTRTGLLLCSLTS